MKLELFAFFLVFHIATGLRKANDEVKHRKKQIDVDCSKISCPPVEDPICMKVKNRKSNRTAFVILLNKCEMRYMRCHKDMEGSTVPMKYCDHTSSSGKNLLGVKLKSHTRNKRSIVNKKGPFTIPPPPVNRNKRDEGGVVAPTKEGNVSLTLHLVEGYDYDEAASDGLDKKRPNKDVEIFNEDSTSGGVVAPTKEGNISLSLHLVEGNDYDEAASDGLDKKRPNKDVEIFNEDSRPGGVVAPTKEGNISLTLHLVEGYDNDEAASDGLDKKRPNKTPDEKRDPSSENEDFLGSPEYDDIYKADCPKECPARVRFVCGQCDHGVYKTFLSTCHLRLFNCAQDIERMQLITRHSCLSSSPLLTGDPGEDLHLEPDGRVYDRDDADPVLAFIRCRNRNSIMVDENGLEIIDASACKDIGRLLRQDEDYEN